MENVPTTYTLLLCSQKKKKKKATIIIHILLMCCNKISGKNNYIIEIFTLFVSRIKHDTYKFDDCFMLNIRIGDIISIRNILCRKKKKQFLRVLYFPVAFYSYLIVILSYMIIYGLPFPMYIRINIAFSLRSFMKFVYDRFCLYVYHIINYTKKSSSEAPQIPHNVHYILFIRCVTNACPDYTRELYLHYILLICI